MEVLINVPIFYICTSVLISPCNVKRRLCYVKISIVQSTEGKTFTLKACGKEAVEK